MNAKELRQAAEKFVYQWDKHDRYRTTESDKLCFNGDGEPDEVSMARHILATVREDDDEIVTLNWLASLAREDGKLEMVVSMVCRADGLHLSSNGHESPSPATRGEFRTLRRLLGVTLREPPSHPVVFRRIDTHKI